MNKLKNIFNLSKFYIKENENNLRIIKKDILKSEKKYGTISLYIILIFGILYLSTEVISYIVKLGKPEIFLNLILLFMEILIIMKTIMVSLNVFYFSKDIENILHLPLKPIEILISKFNTVLFMNYELELIFALIPMIIYGIFTYAGIVYYLNTIILLIIFPILATLIVSIIMIFLMKTIKLFKNKDLMQIVISFIIVSIIMFIANSSARYIFNNMQSLEENREIVLNNLNEKIIEINKYFLNINPTVNILYENNFLNILFNYIKLIFINLFAFALFIFLGNKLYLEQLLKAKFYYKTKKINKLNLNKKCKKNKIRKSYIKKEFKQLTKNPMFFIQSIYPVIIMTVVLSILIIALVPVFNEVLQREEYKNIVDNLNFDIEAVCLIIGAVQVIGLFNYTSITAFSREGKNAYIIKTLPISLYKQFIYKNIPQIIINVISEVILFTIIYIYIPTIGINYILIMLILSIILTIINSFILCLIDLKMPNLDWDGEYEILKNNKNKLLQYVLIIFNIIFLVFINKIFKRQNLNISLIIFTVILLLILTIFNMYIKKYKNKLFNKIN